MTPRGTGELGIPGWLALQVLRRGIHHGSLELVWPDGRAERIGGRKPGPRAVVRVHREAALGRIATGGGLGLAVAYMDEEIDTPDLAAVMELAGRNLEGTSGGIIPASVAAPVRALWRRVGPDGSDGSIRDAVHHYDLGNEFYAAWLDPTMTYSSGIFVHAQDDLETAQREKYRRLAEAIDIGPGHRVLEIGSGWGGFARFAAADLGATVTTVTVSREQAEYVRQLVEAEGLSGSVEVRLEDFLETRGTFDRIVSIEMIESIPGKRWKEYFTTLRQRLAPDGAVGLQAITIDHRWWRHYLAGNDFIRAYVFPGGQLPSMPILRRLADGAGLGWKEARQFGSSYARTLSAWRERFETAWPRIEAMGFDRRFRRLWNYYLAYCEGAFRSGRTDVGQIVLTAEATWR